MTSAADTHKKKIKDNKRLLLLLQPSREDHRNGSPGDFPKWGL